MKKTDINSSKRLKRGLDRERDPISKIERINEELLHVSERRKLYLLNQRRRLEAIILDQVFSRVFDISDEMVQLEKELVHASGRHKSDLKNKIRRLKVKVTPWKKQKAADDRRPIIARYLEHIRQHGVPDNNTKFIRGLRDDGVLTKSLTQKVGRC